MTRARQIKNWIFPLLFFFSPFFLFYSFVFGFIFINFSFSVVYSSLLHIFLANLTNRLFFHISIVFISFYSFFFVAFLRSSSQKLNFIYNHICFNIHRSQLTDYFLFCFSFCFYIFHFLFCILLSGHFPSFVLWFFLYKYNFYLSWNPLIATNTFAPNPLSTRYLH